MTENKVVILSDIYQTTSEVESTRCWLSLFGWLLWLGMDWLSAAPNFCLFVIDIPYKYHLFFS